MGYLVCESGIGLVLVRLFYPIATVTMKILLLTLTRWQVEGKENIPRKGPLIIVANHLNLIDPPLLGASVPRKIHFMAKKELFRSRISRLVVQAYGAFPVKRGQADREAMRRALELLRGGRVLGMFPEGKRSPDAQLQTPQPGASLLACRSGVSLIPVGISGSEQVRGMSFIFRRPRIKVSIGRPFVLPQSGNTADHLLLSKHSDLIMEHIAEVLPDGYRGSYNPEHTFRCYHGN